MVKNKLIFEDMFLHKQKFGPDKPILRSVRPQIAKKNIKKRFVLQKPSLCEPYPRAIASHLGVYVQVRVMVISLLIGNGKELPICKFYRFVFF